MYREQLIMIYRILL